MIAGVGLKSHKVPSILLILALASTLSNIILLSCLGRQDILPYNDATIQKAVMNLFGFELNRNNYAKLNWAKPYRSILCMYLWRWVDGGMKNIS